MPRNSRVTQIGTLCCMTSLLVCLVQTHVRAGIMRTLPLRELCIKTSEIVVVKSVGQAAFQSDSQEFQVVRVLAGGIAKGETIRVQDLHYYRVGNAIEIGNPVGKEAKHGPIKLALMFLEVVPEYRGKRNAFRPYSSGIRCLTSDGKVLVPSQQINPGPYYLTPDARIDWEKLIAAVPGEIRKVRQVLSLREIKDPAKRNEAIFAWIAAHSAEFRKPSFRANDKDPGWCSLQGATFGWIHESCIAVDSWRALKLSHEIWKGTYYGFETGTPSFSSISGRKLLLQNLIDSRQPKLFRKGALYLLHNSFWPNVHHRRQNDRLSIVGEEEQRKFARKIIPFLKSEDAEFRELAARALLRVSDPLDGALKDRKIDSATSPLIEAYNREPPGQTRIQLAKTLRILTDQPTWKRITGNPGKCLVVLDGFAMNRNYGVERVNFTALKYGMTVPVYEQPTLIIERMDEKAQVIERMTRPLSVIYPKYVWIDGWKPSSGSLQVGVPSANLKAGRWRFTIEGRVGMNADAKWKSEPGIYTLVR